MFKCSSVYRGHPILHFCEPLQPTSVYALTGQQRGIGSDQPLGYHPFSMVRIMYVFRCRLEPTPLDWKPEVPHSRW